jgi:tetratricopeptide (TPR) repeat protein
LSGAGLAVSGTVFSAGPDSVRLSASVLDVAAQRSLGDVEIRGSVARMDQLTDSLAVTLLRELSQTRSMTAVRSGSLRATSLPALKAFLQGEQSLRHSEFDSAIAHYEKAIALDSTLAMAYYHLAGAMGWARPGTERAQEAYSLRAGALTRGLAPADSLLLTAHALFTTAIAASSGSQPGTPGSDPEVAREGAPGIGGAAPTQVGVVWDEAKRLFATLEMALRRYPENPDIWYHLGEARVHFGALFGVRQADALAAFDRAIALDSTFAPAYEHTVDLALDVGGVQAARHQARAYLRLHRVPGFAPFLAVSQPGIDPDSIAHILAPLSADDQVELIFLCKRYRDTTETAVRLVRRVLAADPASVHPSIRRVGLRILAYRGHLREALAQARHWPDAKVYPFAARFGSIPADSARVLFAGWLAGKSPRASQALPWWAWARDTTSLLEFVRWQETSAGAVAHPYLRAVHRYWASAGRGFLALAKGDSLQSLRWFVLAPDSICAACLQERLIRAQLLAGAGRLREAAAILEDESQWIDSSPTPIEVLWALERARVAERVGERSQAIKSYQLAADAWRHADPELQPFAREARDGLVRLVDSSLAR